MKTPYTNCNEEQKQIQRVLLAMLHEFDDYCKAHDIQYTLEGGTALGAYRHQGFIPWDDDIDIRMDRAEYKKFCKAMSESTPTFLRLQNHHTDSLYLNGYAKLRDTRTFFKEQRVNIEYAENGCFIDIFPFEKAFPILIAIYHWIHRPLFALAHIPLHKHLLLRKTASLYYILCKGVACFFRLISKLLRCKAYSYSYGCNIYTFKWRYRDDIFDKIRYLKFEDREFPAPGKIEEYLTIHYGTDYMKLPSKENQIPHHVSHLEIKKGFESFFQ